MGIEDLSAHWKDRAEFSEAKVERLEARVAELETAIHSAITVMHQGRGGSGHAITVLETALKG